MEQKTKELKKQQVAKRKSEELNQAKKVRDMIEENRRRVQLQSELLSKGKDLDPEYQRHLHRLTASGYTNIKDEMENFALQSDMVEDQEN